MENMILHINQSICFFVNGFNVAIQTKSIDLHSSVNDSSSLKLLSNNKNTLY